MKVLLFSDHHSHKWKSHSIITENGINSRLQQGIDVLTEITDICYNEEIDFVFFGGDLFHVRNPISVDTFNMTYDAIKNLAANVHGLYMLVGNHDQLNRIGNVYNIHAFENIEGVKMMDHVGYWDVAYEGEVLSVLSAPYDYDVSYTEQCVNELLCGIKSNTRCMLLGHFGIDKALVGSNHVLRDKHLLTTENICFSRFNKVFLGHYHKHQQLAPNAYYIGSTMAQDWGDQGDRRGCLIWDTESDEVIFHELTSPRFLLDPKQDEVKGNFVKITSNYDKELQDKLYDLGALDVEFEADKSEDVTFGAIAMNSDINELLDTYIDNFNESLDADYLKTIGADILKELE
jgi:DNA repair exonuclease SbcCD nuclease subunit